MATQKGHGLVSRAVREALSTLMSPQLCEQLISRSLASQGLSAVPESGAEIGEWLEGALRGEVETAVGPDAADLMMMQLGPIAAYAAIAQPSVPTISQAPANVNASPARGSDPQEDDRPTDMRELRAQPDWTVASAPPAQARASSPRKFRSDPPTGVFSAPPEASGPVASLLRPSSDPPVRTLPPIKRVSDVPPAAAPQPPPVPASANRSRTARPLPSEGPADEPASILPLVLVATGSKDALHSLRRYLVNAANVVHVPDLVGLLDALEEPEIVEPVVLIDCHSPTVHISSVSAIGEDLPRGTTVVLWGVDETTWQQIDRDRSPACRWVRCSSEATTDDVGSLCSMLLG